MWNIAACWKWNGMIKMTNMMTWWTRCTHFPSLLHIITLGTRVQIWVHFNYLDSISYQWSVWLERLGGACMWVCMCESTCMHIPVPRSTNVCAPLQVSEIETTQSRPCKTQALCYNPLWANQNLQWGNLSNQRRGGEWGGGRKRIWEMQGEEARSRKIKKIWGLKHGYPLWIY